jgi:serine/threonine protein kinase/Flp pilus assembly protein TadD
MMRPMEDRSNPSALTHPGDRSEEALFDALLALAPEKRAAYLDAVCAGNTQLRQRLQSLLQSHEQAGDFLEPTPPPVGSSPTMIIPTPVTEKAGDSIGRYKLREKLGEGGCGAVYVADQTEPVRRRVALKIIKLGMDTRNVIARFEAERQALAMMDHPNIAKVLDAGATETGRPYFVMELVRGIKITDYCDQHHLNTTQRLDLFIQVCHAVQHAHQKGVIHRDIKPSNILVTLHDGVPVPKVIDFGIAKATEGRLSTLTVYTELHQFIGTPAYMSPEQAEMSGLDIDTRSDIYSLGVLLYELLTGRTPFDAQGLVQSGLDRMRQTIREKEPPRPSTRLSEMGHEDLTSVAKRHGAEAPRLIHLIRGDLDWIVMKALEKDRTRRFETASALATDVQRFLQNEPVEARPPSTFYRFQKLVRRNKTVFVAATAVFASLVLGLGLSLYLFIKEREAHHRAVVAEKKQAELREEAEKGLAIERKLREIKPATDKMTEAGRLMSRGQFDKAEELMSQTMVDIPQSSIIYNALGDSHCWRGQYGGAITNFARSIMVDPTNYLAYQCLAPLLLQSGDIDAYQRLRQKILSQFASTSIPAIAASLARACLLSPATTNDLEKVMKMVQVATSPGQDQSAAQDIELLRGLGEYRKQHFAAAVETLSGVVTNAPNTSRTVGALAVLAMAQQQLGNLAEARDFLVKGLELSARKTPDGIPQDWIEPLTARLLIQEAKTAVGGHADTAAQAK